MQQQESPQHAAHMGEMSHVAHAPPSEEQLDDGIDDDEPLGLHRNRRNQQHDDRIGMHHAERQQQAHHRARRADQQQLLFPERLVLSGDEYALLEENAVEFAALGFDIDFCGEGTVEVRGTPADMPADAVDRLLFDLLQAFATPVSLSDVRREKIAGVMARSGAKGAGRTLSREEAAALLAQLADTGSFSFSPSGKAITAEITPEDLRAKLG